MNESFFFSVLVEEAAAAATPDLTLRLHPSPGAPPVCPQCQDKDPSQLGQETDQPPTPLAQAHFL